MLHFLDSYTKKSIQARKTCVPVYIHILESPKSMFIGQVFQSVSTQGSQSACGEALSQPGEPACCQPLVVWGVSSRHGGCHFTRPRATSSAAVCSSVKTTAARFGWGIEWVCWGVISG